MIENIQISFFLSCLFIFQSLLPITKNQARIVGLSTGVGATIATAGISYWGKSDLKWWDSLLSPISGLICGYCAYQVALLYTSEGYLEASHELIRSFEQSVYMDLINKDYPSDEEFFKAVSYVFITHNFWLVAAQQQLIQNIVSLQRVQSYAQSAQNMKPNDLQVQKETRELLARAKFLMGRLYEIVIKIRQHPSFETQLHEYHNMIQKEKELQLLQQNLDYAYHSCSEALFVAALRAQENYKARQMMAQQQQTIQNIKTKKNR